MTSQIFSYDKKKVIQALRYHFISRKEIKLMIILVNVFAIVSAILFFYKKILPLPFLVSSVLWFVLMITFWFLLPFMIYKKSDTFRDRFKVNLADDKFTIANEKGSQSWQWNKFSSWIESPFFFHVYFNNRTFFIIPKDAFAESQLQEIREIFKKKIVK